jgi:hypothetical protein
MVKVNVENIQWREETCESCIYCLDEECKINAPVHFYNAYEGHLAVWPSVVTASMLKKFHKACAKWKKNVGVLNNG